MLFASSPCSYIVWPLREGSCLKTLTGWTSLWYLGTKPRFLCARPAFNQPSSQWPSCFVWATCWPFTGLTISLLQTAHIHSVEQFSCCEHAVTNKMLMFVSIVKRTNKLSTCFKVKHFQSNRSRIESSSLCVVGCLVSLNSVLSSVVSADKKEVWRGGWRFGGLALALKCVYSRWKRRVWQVLVFPHPHVSAWAGALRWATSCFCLCSFLHLLLLDPQVAFVRRLDQCVQSSVCMCAVFGCRHQRITSLILPIRH